MKHFIIAFSALAFVFGVGSAFAGKVPEAPKSHAPKTPEAPKPDKVKTPEAPK
jgi:hypothetical protein